MGWPLAKVCSYPAGKIGQGSQERRVDCTNRQGGQGPNQRPQAEIACKLMEELVQSHLARITRLNGKEDLMKKSYVEMKKKSDEKLEGCGDLRDFKLETPEDDNLPIQNKVRK